MRLIEHFQQTILDKYKLPLPEVSKNCSLLMDTIFLKALNILNDESVEFLAQAANVHPKFIGQIMLDFDRENQELKLKEPTNEPEADKAEEKVVVPLE